MRIRPTLRVRLTAVYGISFFLAGALLLAVVYVLVGYNIERAPVGVLAEGPPPEAPVFPPPTAVVSPRPEGVVLESTIGAVRSGTQRALLQQSIAVLAVVGALATATGWLLAGRVLRPLAGITATARRVADRSLHERIDLRGPADELKELADTFDAMLDRLDRAFDAQRRFVGNAAHELRTPLAIQRTVLEVALARKNHSPDLDRVADVLLAANARSEGMIEGLLLLARSEQAVVSDAEVDLAHVAQEAVEQSRTEADAASLRLRTSLSPAVCRGEAVLLERLVVNLVQNAVRHNMPGGELEVTTAAEGDAATVTVTNTGRRIPSYEVEGLFEPFRRGAERVESARGVGLGLSIVTSIATAHGGSVHAEPGPDGGLRMTVALPRRAFTAP